MTIRTEYNGSIVEVIEIENAYVLGINFSNKSYAETTDHVNEPFFDKPYVYLKRILPNGSSIVFLIIKADEELISKYKGFTALVLNYDGINIKATL